MSFVLDNPVVCGWRVDFACLPELAQGAAMTVRTVVSRLEGSVGLCMAGRGTYQTGCNSSRMIRRNVRSRVPSLPAMCARKASLIKVW